jgi:hypothetical protein
VWNNADGSNQQHIPDLVPIVDNGDWLQRQSLTVAVVVRRHEAERQGGIDRTICQGEIPLHTGFRHLPIQPLSDNLVVGGGGGGGGGGDRSASEVLISNPSAHASTRESLLSGGSGGSATTTTGDARDSRAALLSFEKPSPFTVPVFRDGEWVR